VRLAALDLRWISGWIWRVLGWILGFLDSRVHLNLHVTHFCINVAFCVNCVELNVDVALTRRLHDTDPMRHLADLSSDLVPKITCWVGEPGLISASGFEHPASTLPTRFPVALGIGHDPAYGLANACALVYVAA